MENLEKKFKEIDDIPFPEDLHGKIMRKIYFSRIKNLLIPAIALLLVSMSILGWRIWARIAEADAIHVTQATFDGFEPSFSYVNAFTQMVAETFPVNLMIIFATNAVMLVFLIGVLSGLKKLSDAIKGRMIYN